MQPIHADEEAWKKNNCYYYSYTVKVKHLVAVKKTNASVPDWKIAIMLWNWANNKAPATVFLNRYLFSTITPQILLPQYIQGHSWASF